MLDRTHSSDGHGHHRHTTAEGYASRPHPEQVVLDIGGDLGALIVHTGPHMVGVEIEISADARDNDRTHKEVLEREINGRPAYTAVFDKLEHGAYTLWVGDAARARGVAVSAGAVSELDWSAGVS
jgi:hypothetical protein